MPPSEPAQTPLTLAGAVRQVAASLRAAGVDDPAAEARWLVAAAAAVEPLDVIVAASRPLDTEAADRIDVYTRRRSAREPLSRILGRRSFYGRDFLLSAGTLDPRPETEALVDMVLDICAEPPWLGRPIEILDVGTGTGAILITLLAELLSARGRGIDISRDALKTAGANAVRHGVEERATFVPRDVRGGLHDEWSSEGRGYDFIVSNPPYIASAELGHLQPEVRLYDPAAALDGGREGLDFYHILAASMAVLAPGGWMVVEVGAGQSATVADLFQAAAPGAAIRMAVDLAGHTRIVAVQPRPHNSDE